MMSDMTRELLVERLQALLTGRERKMIEFIFEVLGTSSTPFVA